MNELINRIKRAFIKVESAVLRAGLLSRKKCDVCKGSVGKRPSGGGCADCRQLECGIEGCESRARHFLNSALIAHMGRQGKQKYVQDDFPVCETCFDRVMAYRRASVRGMVLFLTGSVIALAGVAAPICYLTLEEYGRQASSGRIMTLMKVGIVTGSVLIILGNILCARAARNAPPRRKQRFVIPNVTPDVARRVPHCRGFWMFLAKERDT